MPDIKPEEIIAECFPELNDLKAEIIRRKSIEEKQYHNIRDLDI